jgi:hypothetical protein
MCQHKHSIAAFSSASHRDAGNKKHAAARHLPLLELQPALPQSRVTEMLTIVTASVRRQKDQRQREVR